MKAIKCGIGILIGAIFNILAVISGVQIFRLMVMRFEEITYYNSMFALFVSHLFSVSAIIWLLYLWTLYTEKGKVKK